MFLEVNGKFKKPYFIDCLGAEGLSAADVARALNTEAKHVRQKLKNGWIEKACNNLKLFAVEISTSHNTTNSSTFDEYYLNTYAAKAFVAQYQNEIGFKYLEFLFQCEALAMKELPFLLQQRQELEQKLMTMERSSKMLSRPPQKFCYVPIYQNSLEGFPEQVTFVRKPLAEVKQPELALGQLAHATRTLEGLKKKVKALEDFLLGKTES